MIHNSIRDGINFSELINAIFRRKNILIISTSLTLIATYVFNFFSEPTYHSVIMIKKEMPTEKRNSGQLGNVLQLGNSDEMNTGMELIKSRIVLEKVVEELNLDFKIDRIVLPNGEVDIIDKNLNDYSEMDTDSNVKFYTNPIFLKVNENKFGTVGEYYIQKLDQNLFGLYNTRTDSLLQVVKY